MGVFGSHTTMEGGVVNKAACVIYGAELQHRNVLRGCTHLQKPSQEVCLSLGRLRFMWRPDASPPVWKYKEFGGGSWGHPPKRGDD